MVAKISDFGLTRSSPKGTSTTMMTERIMGTCAYMAPEALRGQVTPKSDIFSFGVVGSLHTHAHMQWLQRVRADEVLLSDPRLPCDPQVLLEILSGLPPVDDDRDPEFLVRKRRSPTSW